MNRKLKRAGCVLAVAVTVAGCTAQQMEQGTGALLGAATGAGIAALAGGDTATILGSAAVGAVAGWGVVKLVQYTSTKTSSAEDAATAMGYSGEEGTVVRIRGAQAAPAEIRAGGAVELGTEYAVVAPSSRVVPVVETIELWKDNRLVRRFDPVTVQREQGGWRSSVTLPIPEQAPPGTYVVKSRVEADGSNDERQAFFVVAREAA